MKSMKECHSMVLYLFFMLMGKSKGLQSSYFLITIDVYHIFLYRKETTSGVFWLNAAETWVDILSKADNNVVESIVNFVSGSAKKPQVDAHFMSESGVIDVFFLLGPEPMDVFTQYTKLTGSAHLPPVST